jgi:hypothetical protein
LYIRIDGKLADAEQMSVLRALLVVTKRNDIEKEEIVDTAG